MSDTIYIVFKGKELVCTTSTLEKAQAWQKATSDSVIYVATLMKYEETI